MKVVIADLIVEPLDYERSVLDGHADAKSEAELIGRIEDADAVMFYHCFRFTKSIIERVDSAVS